MRVPSLALLLAAMQGTFVYADGHTGVTFPAPTKWIARGEISEFRDDGTFSIVGYEHTFTLFDTEILDKGVAEELLGQNVFCFSPNRQSGVSLPPVSLSPIPSICQFQEVDGRPSLIDHLVVNGQAVRTCNSGHWFCQK